MTSKFCFTILKSKSLTISPINFDQFINIENKKRILFEDELIEFFTPLLTRETRNLRSKSMSGLNDIIFNQVTKIFSLTNFIELILENFEVVRSRNCGE